MLVSSFSFVFLFLLFCYLLRFFFFNDTATTEIYTLSLHDALPIALQRIAEAAPTGALHQQEIAGQERKAADLAGQGRRRDPLPVALYPETVTRAGLAAAHAERWQHGLLSEHGQRRRRRLDAYRARETEPA